MTSLYIFSVRWHGSIDQQPLAHHAFTSLGKKFIYQWEKGERTDRDHLQGYISLKERSWHTGKPLGAAFNALGLNGCECSGASNEGIAALKDYVTKAETRIAGPWADRPIYLGRDIACMNNPRPWQQSLMDILSKHPNSRTIYWINDGRGNVGKSVLIKHLCFNGLAKKVPMGNATQLKTNVIQQGPSRIYVGDLPRTLGTTEKMTDLISACEEIKNGYVSSAMYGKHQELFMEPPHLVLFANMPPPREMMSQDRWRVFTIDPMFYTLNNCQTCQNILS